MMSKQAQTVREQPVEEGVMIPKYMNTVELLSEQQFGVNLVMSMLRDSEKNEGMIGRDSALKLLRRDGTRCMEWVKEVSTELNARMAVSLRP